jgi:transposase-like protein
MDIFVGRSARITVSEKVRPRHRRDVAPPDVSAVARRRSQRLAPLRQADIDDGYAPGVSTAESQRVKELEQEIRELKRANEILKRAASFFGAELDRQHKK